MGGPFLNYFALFLLLFVAVIVFCSLIAPSATLRGPTTTGSDPACT